MEVSIDIGINIKWMLLNFSSIKWWWIKPSLFSGSFYLCRTQQNVFSNTRHFKIQWLDMVEPPDVYKFDFHDHTEIECVLMNVKMDKVARETYRLPESEKARIENILTKALKKEKGELIDEDLTVEEVTEEPLDEEDDDEGLKLDLNICP